MPRYVLGGRWQTVRRLIDSGVIGEPSGFMAHVGTHGVERHHPNPDFYYQRGRRSAARLGTLLSHCDGIFVWLDTKSLRNEQSKHGQPIDRERS